MCKDLPCDVCGRDLLGGPLHNLVVLWDHTRERGVGPVVVHKECGSKEYDSSFCGEQLRLDDPFVALYSIGTRHAHTAEDLRRLLEIFFTLHLQLYPETKINPHVLC